MGIKRTPADAAFSNCVRYRVDYCCEVCGRDYPDSSTRMGLHCSHLFGRRNYSVRFDPRNAFSHCYSCHKQFSENPVEFHLWARAQIGEGAIALLRERMNDHNLGKSVRKNLKEVAAHFRGELDRMAKLRSRGKKGHIEFVGYA